MKLDEPGVMNAEHKGRKEYGRLGDVVNDKEYKVLARASRTFTRCYCVAVACNIESPRDLYTLLCTALHYFHHTSGSQNRRKKIWREKIYKFEISEKCWFA